MNRIPTLLTVMVATMASLTVSAHADFSLAPGKTFPVISMPDSASGELKSIADFRGEKLMLQIFASW